MKKFSPYLSFFFVCLVLTGITLMGMGAASPLVLFLIFILAIVPASYILGGMIHFAYMDLRGIGPSVKNAKSITITVSDTSPYRHDDIIDITDDGSRARWKIVGINDGDRTLILERVE